MRANVNILTAASENAVAIQVTGYQNATAAHVVGDLGVHNQVLFYATPFAEPVTGHTIYNGYLLRLQLTGTNADGSGDGVFTCPAILTGVSADIGGPPAIIRQPQALSLFVGQTATFTVKAISADPMTYQWRKNGTAIAGATASTLVLTNVQTTSQATYDVVVTNAFGSATSTTAALTVAVPSTGFNISQDGCFLPDTLISMADGSQRQIKDIKIGDRVLSYQIAGLDPSNELAWKTWATTSLALTATAATVKEVFKQTFTGYIQLLDLKVTYEHPLLTRRGGVWKFREVQDIQKGDFLWKNGMTIPVDSLRYIAGDIDTYNLNVETTDVYLANGVIAHNNFFKSIWKYITPETAILGIIANGP